MRLIDADALKFGLEKVTLYVQGLRFGKTVLGKILEAYRRAVYEEIENAPTIDPEELRPKGEWVGEADGYADGELVYDVWNCSECTYCIDDGTDDPELLPNYCPNCGAKMRGAKYE